MSVEETSGLGGRILKRDRPAGTWMLAAMLMVAPTWGQDAEEPVPETETAEGTASGTQPQAGVFDQLLVVGSATEAEESPGSAYYLGEVELERQSYGDIHRILRQVPGVNMQEEEGYGLRPNIGMRGTGVERSQKVTLLEDGVLIAPAPYAAPAAYYFPTAARMEAVEVRKGSSSIRQGPYTNGGVLNMVSASIPGAFGGRLRATAGEDSTYLLHGRLGDTRERYGWLLEALHNQTDGFKRLDGGGDTGYELEDYLGKVRFNSDAATRFYQALEIKLGITDQVGGETYTGLTDGDFAASPRRRYAGSQRDTITTDHEQVQLRHYLKLGDGIDLTTTAYRNDFFRNWYKLETVSGRSIAAVLADPASFSRELGIVRGEIDATNGPLNVRGNSREYYSEGAQSIFSWTFDTPSVGHQLQVGGRYHQDEEDRFQAEDRWSIVDGRMSLFSTGAPGSNANRVVGAEALAFYVQDRITAGRFTVTPGVRYESIDMTSRDFGRNDPRRTGAALVARDNGVEVFVPGVGATFALNPTWMLIAGVHKGFAPSAPGQSADTKAEESVSFEAGFRVAGPVALTLLGFYNDYDNLLGTDTVSGGGGGTGDQSNGGAVEVRGLELALSADLGNSLDLALGIPLRLTYTYTSAEFRSSFSTDFADWAPSVEVGDELPYLPESQLYLSLGLASRRWSVNAGFAYQDETRTTAGQGPIPAGQGLESHFLVDLAGDVVLHERLRLQVQLRNATDETYVTARRPAGLRPGLPRTALLGFSWDF